MLSRLHPRIWSVFGLCLALCGCGLRETSSADDATYLTSVAEIGDVRDVVPATGILLADGAAEIRASEPGVIEAVFVKEGDRVTAGQILARLVAPGLLPVRDEALAATAAAAADVRQAELALKAAEQDRDRRAALMARGFVSSIQLEVANGAVEQAQANLARARADASAAAARVRRAAADATGMDVRAPVAGVVVMSLAYPGLRVTPTDARPLFQTSNGAEELTLEILIPEPDMSRVRTDSRVEFTVDAYPQQRNDAVLLSIGEAPLREGRFVSYRAIADVSNPGGVLLHGMTASVQFIGADAERVLRIPARALYFRPENYLPPLSPEELQNELRETGGDMELVRAGASGAEFGRLYREGRFLVFSLKDGELVRHEVRVGAETDEFIEITEGLKGGEVIVVGHRPLPRSDGT